MSCERTMRGDGCHPYTTHNSHCRFRLRYLQGLFLLIRLIAAEGFNGRDGGFDFARSWRPLESHRRMNGLKCRRATVRSVYDHLFLLPCLPPSDEVFILAGGREDGREELKSQFTFSSRPSLSFGRGGLESRRRLGQRIGPRGHRGSA